MIEGTFPLPGLVLLRSKSYPAQCYSSQHLSGRQIAQLAGVSRSAVLTALERCGIPRKGDGRSHPGQLPFGYGYCDYQLVPNKAEQGVIRLIRRYRAGGLSLRQIAGQLNGRLIYTKNNRVWHANTVRLVLARV